MPIFPRYYIIAGCSVTSFSDDFKKRVDFEFSCNFVVRVGENVFSSVFTSLNGNGKSLSLNSLLTPLLSFFFHYLVSRIFLFIFLSI